MVPTTVDSTDTTADVTTTQDAPDTTESAPAPVLDGFDTAEIEVGTQDLTVAVALTSSQRSQGLRGVEELPDGMDGLLFVFGDPRTASFVMSDTLIPLDIWWFDADGRLVGSAEMEPCTSVFCDSYRSPQEVTYALESPLGEVELEPGAMLTVLESS